MPKAEQNATTSCTGAAPVLPSILDLGLLMRAINDQAEGYDEARLAAKEHTPEWTAAEKGYLLAFEREEALRELAETLPARSLGDAAVQIYLAFLEVDFLQAHELDTRQIDIRVSKLRRLVSSILPVVTHCAGLTIEQIGGEETERLLSREHPAVEA